MPNRRGVTDMEDEWMALPTGPRRRPVTTNTQCRPQARASAEHVREGAVAQLMSSWKSRFVPLLLAPWLLGAAFAVQAAGGRPHPAPHRALAAAHKGQSAVAHAPKPAPAHLVGKKQTGKASYYSLAGRKMADGTRMNPASNAAASKTLPLGTKARVKNLENGRSAVVEIKDRGPYVKGRIVDLTPSTARLLGMGKDGVISVEIEPIFVPAR